MVSIVFVCFGNICRSPLAAAIFSTYLQHHYPSLVSNFIIESAGTGSHEVGSPADPRSVRAAKENELNLKGVHGRIKLHIAQWLTEEMILKCDFILVMDDSIYQEVKERWENLKATNVVPPSLCGRLFLFGNFSTLSSSSSSFSSSSMTVEAMPKKDTDVIIEDPWYGPYDHFLTVYNQCLQSTKGFLEFYFKQNKMIVAGMNK